ncbi:MAG: hypothetical protein RQ758_07555 [Methanomicrobiaceae archaeon]|nr:hypothetical protein [Methanomicrobiaceae archaeon]
MMKGAIFILAMAVVVVAAVAVFVMNESSPSVTITSLSTDKAEYHSRETMEISVNLSASQPVDNYLVKVEGITDKRGRTRLMQEQPVNLSAGREAVTFKYQLPACNTCSGISEGEYAINATLVRDNVTVANASTTILLSQ